MTKILNYFSSYVRPKTLTGLKDCYRTLEALYAIESNQHNSQDSENSDDFGSDHEERRAIRRISATEEIPNEVKNWLTETFIRGNVIKNLGKFVRISRTASPSSMDVLCGSVALDRPDSGHPWSKLTDFSKPVIFFRNLISNFVMALMTK